MHWQYRRQQKANLAVVCVVYVTMYFPLPGKATGILQQHCQRAGARLSLFILPATSCSAFMLICTFCVCALARTDFQSPAAQIILDRILRKQPLRGIVAMQIQEEGVACRKDTQLVKNKIVLLLAKMYISCFQICRFLNQKLNGTQRGSETRPLRTSV